MLVEFAFYWKVFGIYLTPTLIVLPTTIYHYKLSFEG